MELNNLLSFIEEQYRYLEVNKCKILTT